jgi:hypothetical protein
MRRHEFRRDFRGKRCVEVAAAMDKNTGAGDHGIISGGPTNFRNSRRPKLPQVGSVFLVEIYGDGSGRVDRMNKDEELLHDRGGSVQFEMHNTVTRGII